VIKGTLDNNYSSVHGILRDGRKISCDLPRMGTSTAVGGKEENTVGVKHDPYVGLQTKDGWWVKAVLEGDGNSYLLSKGEGRSVHYCDLSREELLLRLS